MIPSAFFCSGRRLPMWRYRSSPRSQTQELRSKPFMSVPASPQSSLLRSVTSALKTTLAKLVVTHITPTQMLVLTPSTILSTITERVFLFCFIHFRCKFFSLQTRNLLNWEMLKCSCVISACFNIMAACLELSATMFLFSFLPFVWP